VWEGSVNLSFPLSPLFLRGHGSRCTRILQLPGEVMVTRPRVYHQVINLGPTLDLAVNFATPSWLEKGVHAKACKQARPYFL